ncbi:MAG: cupin domain-containing protein [Gammaproteobacteria bacterium]
MSDQGNALAVFRKMGQQDGFVWVSGLYEGKGSVGVRRFFREEGAPLPALLLTYTLPAGSSEGLHTHRLGDETVGSFDEFYYIMEGSGEMEIEGKKVPVTVGDHLFIPNGVSHGIENTATQGDLKVYLVAMVRDER